MAYTHCWKQTRDFTHKEFSWIKTQFQKMMSAPRPTDEEMQDPANECDIRPDYDCGWTGFTEHPDLLDEAISFNGATPGQDYSADDDLAHETFTLTKSINDIREFSAGACATARMPYDTFVAALLACAALAAPDAFTVITDGTLDDWEPAMRFLRRTTGTDLKFTIDSEQIVSFYATDLPAGAPTTTTGPFLSEDANAWWRGQKTA